MKKLYSVKASRETGFDSSCIGRLSCDLNQFSGTFTAEYDGREANMQHLMEAVTVFSFLNGGELTITCEGEDEEDAINAIETFLRKKEIIF